MVEDLLRIGMKPAAYTIISATKMVHKGGKMDMDVYATYLNIFRGYKIKDVRRTEDNKIFIYFEISEQPIILVPQDAGNATRDI